MIYLTKEATNKDQSVKMQMMLSYDKEDPANYSEKIWNSNGFFGNQREDFTIKKPNLPENTLVHCNQGTISTLKAGDYAIYLDYVVLGGLILANNCPDLDNYKLKENEVIPYVPLYNTKNGYFRGVKKWLAYIMVWGDSDETFSSYGCDQERSKIMYFSFEHPLPNIFQGTIFKKHTKRIKEKQTEDSSKLFFFLPSTTDRKEKNSKSFNNVHLHPIDCAYEDFSNYSLKKKNFTHNILIRDFQLNEKQQNKLF